MRNPISGLHGLSGDALIAFGEALGRLGEAVRGGAPNVDLDLPHADPAMECDGPLLSWPAPPPVTPAEVRAALDELSDSTLFGICATIIEGWKPLLFTSDVGREASADVDVLVQTLRDRRDQFHAVEHDADCTILTPVQLDDLTRPPRRGE